MDDKDGHDLKILLNENTNTNMSTNTNTNTNNKESNDIVINDKNHNSLKVKCPICGTLVIENMINSHLDDCLI